jgi:hypothetical protein
MTRNGGAGSGEAGLAGEAFSPEDMSFGSIDAMRRDPRMAAAMRISVNGALDYARATPLMHRNVKDMGRFILGMVALYLDATGGLTHRRLRSLSGRTGLISAGAASAVLLRLRLIGYVSPADGQTNGQVRLYRPTPAMIEVFRERIRIEMTAAAQLYPKIAAILPRFAEPEAFPAAIAAIGVDVVEGARAPHPTHEGLSRVSPRSAGMMILYRIIADADAHQGAQGAFPPVTDAEVSVSAIAREFEVSRSHVLAVLREAEQGGLMTALGDGRWRLEPALQEAVQVLYAVSYMGMNKGARAAYAALARKDAANR